MGESDGAVVLRYDPRISRRNEAKKNPQSLSLVAFWFLDWTASVQIMSE